MPILCRDAYQGICQARRASEAGQSRGQRSLSLTRPPPGPNPRRLCGTAPSSHQWSGRQYAEELDAPARTGPVPFRSRAPPTGEITRTLGFAWPAGPRSTDQAGESLATSRADSKSCTGLPDKCSAMICLPPTPVTTGCGTGRRPAVAPGRAENQLVPDPAWAAMWSTRPDCRSGPLIRRGCLVAFGADVLAVHSRDAECQVQ